MWHVRLGRGASASQHLSVEIKTRKCLLFNLICIYLIKYKSSARCRLLAVCGSHHYDNALYTPSNVTHISTTELFFACLANSFSLRRCLSPPSTLSLPSSAAAAAIYLTFDSTPFRVAHIKHYFQHHSRYISGSRREIE